MERKVMAETERLLMYEMAPEDAEHFYLLNKDPEVMRYLRDRVFESVEESRIFLENYPAYKKHGIGRWTVKIKDTGEFVGWCGLKYNEDIQEVDIGYRLKKIHWNKGYATEASLVCLDYGFNVMKYKRIIGRADKDNGASRRVLEKLGLKFEKYYFEEGVESVLYAIEK